MSIPWSEITDAEIAAGVAPSAVVFSKLANNPRAVLYGDVTVPYAKRILTELTASPAIGAAGEYVRSLSIAGVSAIDVGPLDIQTAIFGNSLSSLTPATATPFGGSNAGYFTIFVIGGGGGGATSVAPTVGYGSRSNGGGSGGFVRAVVRADPLDEVTYQTGGSGSAGSPGGDTFIQFGTAWRMEAKGGGAGQPIAGFGGLGKGGKASLSGFARGYAVPGGTARMGLGGRVPYGYNAGSLAAYGRGGNYNQAGRIGFIAILRGVW
jgi:hypothetical protein